MPSKKRKIRADSAAQFLEPERIKFIRDLAVAAAGAQSDPSAYSAIITTANAQLGKFERGYFLAWRDAFLAIKLAVPL